MRLGSASIACFALAGCASVNVSYMPPALSAPPSPTVRVIDKPRDAVWDSSVPRLGKESLVINSLDRSSGVVSISYNGDVARYIDCGRATSDYSGPPGPRTDDFPYSKHQQLFYANDLYGNLVFIDQRMSLEAHTNLVFEAVSLGQTRVSANTLYTVRRQQTVSSARHQIPATDTDTISFNSGGGASFPATNDSLPSQCIATGNLERELLSMIQ